MDEDEVDLHQICQKLMRGFPGLVGLRGGEKDSHDENLRVDLQGEERKHVEGSGPVVLILVMQVSLDTLHQLGHVLERVDSLVLHHLADAVKGGETELICVLCPEAGGDKAVHHQGEVTLQAGSAAVVQQSLQATYGNQFDLQFVNFQ